MGKKLITYTLVIYSDLCLLDLAVLHLITKISNASNINYTDIIYGIHNLNGHNIYRD